MDALNKLEGLAVATDAETQANIAAEVPVDPNAPPPPPSADEQAADLVNMFAGLVTGYAPEAGAIWTPEARTASAAAIAPVMEKYNFSFANIPPELAAAVVVGPLLWQTSKIVAAKMKDARQATTAPSATAAAPADDAAPGPAVHPQMGLYKAGAV